MKQYEVILRATNNNDEKFDLDLSDSPEFLLDISAIESQDIGKVYGISSQEFALPGTPTNNKFFNNLFDLGTVPAVGLTYTVPCQVLVDGAAVYTGKLYVDNIITDQYYDVIYNCVVVNEIIDFRTRIDTRALTDLDWSAYNHPYTWVSISQSFFDQLLDGDIFYPLANYGKDPNDATAAKIEFGGAVLQIDNQATPIRVTDFKPAIRAKAVVDTIFDSVGYRYSSSFFNSDYFKSVYLLTTANNGRGAITDSTISQSCVITKTSDQTIPFDGNYYVVQFNNEVFDNGGNFNPSTFQYTADISGSYTINVSIPFSIDSYTGRDIQRVVDVVVYVNGSQRQFIFQPLPNTSAGTIGFSPFQTQLLPGDIVTIQIAYFSGVGSPESFRVLQGDNTFFKVIGPPNAIGRTVDMGLQFPSELKVTDFLQGLINKYNLVIEPLPNDQNVLIIEPFNDWVNQGQTVDWTDKVDRNVKFKIEHPLLGEPKNLLFTDALDEDYLNQSQKEMFDNTYGQYDFFSDSDLVEGSKTISTIFAATPVKGIQGGPTTVIPQLYKLGKNNTSDPFNFKPRLLHKQALKTVAPNEAKGVSGGATGFYYVNDGSTTFPFRRYRTLGPTTLSPVSFAGGFDIHFDNLSYYPPQQNFVQGRTNNSAYSVYWAFQINELFDVDTRLVTMNVILNPAEIQNIRLNSRIFIDGHYYRINKIQGANLIEEQSTTVELLKTLPRKLPFPRRRIYTAPDTFVDVIQGDYNENGSTTYNRFEDGATVDSIKVATIAAGRDNNEVFDLSPNGIVWDKTVPVIKNPGVFIVGNVNYDETSNNVLFVGNNISIPNGTANTTVLNPTRELELYNADTVYVGSQVLQGRNATEYSVSNVGAGDTISITSSLDQYPYYLINSTSSGVINFELPDANELDGVEYAIQLSSSFTSGSSVALIPSGSQTVDGAISSSLTITGSSYVFKSISGSWITTTTPSVSVGGGGGTGITSQYISLFDTTDQPLESIGVSQSITFTDVDFNNGITLVSGSRLTVSQSGVYNIQFSAQISKDSGTKSTIYIWLGKNGSNVANTNTSVTLDGGSDDAVVAAWNVYASASANDYYELLWTATSTNTRLEHVLNPPYGPAIPSVILTMNGVA